MIPHTRATRGDCSCSHEYEWHCVCRLCQVTYCRIYPQGLRTVHEERLYQLPLLVALPAAQGVVQVTVNEENGSWCVLVDTLGCRLSWLTSDRCVLQVKQTAARDSESELYLRLQTEGRRTGCHSCLQLCGAARGVVRVQQQQQPGTVKRTVPDWAPPPPSLPPGQSAGGLFPPSPKSWHSLIVVQCMQQIGNLISFY